MSRPLPLRTSFLFRLNEFNGRLRRLRPAHLCALAVCIGAASLFAAPSAEAGDCPADFDGDGNVDVQDLGELIDNLGDCGDPDDCPWDFNDNDVVDEVDLAYLLESWGPCPSVLPGELELFDQLVAVDATNAEAHALGLIRTHVYATGDNVTEGDVLLIVDDANIDTTDDTTFHQSSRGDNTPPDPDDVQSDPPLAYDTFVAVGLLTDDDTSEDDISLTNDFTMTDTTIDGGWYAEHAQTQRDAVDISEATGESGQFGVLVAQITLQVPCEPPPTGYAGTLRLYTSTHQGGSLQGVQADVQFSVCPADFDGNGNVGAPDLGQLFANDGPCDDPDDCPWDFNYDNVVDIVDLLYLMESWGPCPSRVPVDLELFDEVVIVDVTDAETLALGLIVTNVYTTGDNVTDGDALLIVDQANIDATDSTTFYQHRLGGDTPPDPDDVQSNPPLEYDTFVAVNLLTDDDDTSEDDVSLTAEFTMTDTTIDGGWYALYAQTQRKAVDISEATGEPDQYGVLITQITLQIDPGESTLGYTGTVRLYTSTHDCGALQGVEAKFQFSIGLCSPDLDGDGDVDAADLAQLLGAWGPNPGHPADFDGDGDVDAADLAELLGSWGACP